MRQQLAHLLALFLRQGTKVKYRLGHGQGVQGFGPMVSTRRGKLPDTLEVGVKIYLSASCDRWKWHFECNGHAWRLLMGFRSIGAFLDQSEHFCGKWARPNDDFHELLQ